MSVTEDKRRLQRAMALQRSYEIEDCSFAEACYNDNTIDELLEALTLMHADKDDCEIWDITPTEWRFQIVCALAAKIGDLQEDE